VERQELKQNQVRTIGLTKIKGNKDFSCPNRRGTISLEDETESFYSILETRVRNVSLEELVIVSAECGSNVRLVGFLSIGRR